MTRSPTFSPAAGTAKLQQASGPAALGPSPPGPTSLALQWLHNQAHRSVHRAFRQSADPKLTVPEQEFNSLQAQREACEAFITSQRHEDWVCLPQAYDD